MNFLKRAYQFFKELFTSKPAPKPTYEPIHTEPPKPSVEHLHAKYKAAQQKEDRFLEQTKMTYRQATTGQTTASHRAVLSMMRCHTSNAYSAYDAARQRRLSEETSRRSGSWFTVGRMRV